MAVFVIKWRQKHWKTLTFRRTSWSCEYWTSSWAEHHWLQVDTAAEAGDSALLCTAAPSHPSASRPQLRSLLSVQTDTSSGKAIIQHPIRLHRTTLSDFVIFTLWFCVKTNIVYTMHNIILSAVTQCFVIVLKNRIQGLENCQGSQNLPYSTMVSSTQNCTNIITGRIRRINNVLTLTCGTCDITVCWQIRLRLEL